MYELTEDVEQGERVDLPGFRYGGAHMPEAKTLSLLSPGYVNVETVKERALGQCQARIKGLLPQIDALLRLSAEYEAVKRLLQETPADLLELLQTLLCEQCPRGKRKG